SGTRRHCAGDSGRRPRRPQGRAVPRVRLAPIGTGRLAGAAHRMAGRLLRRVCERGRMPHTAPNGAEARPMNADAIARRMLAEDPDRDARAALAAVDGYTV